MMRISLYNINYPHIPPDQVMSNKKYDIYNIQYIYIYNL